MEINKDLIKPVISLAALLSIAAIYSCSTIFFDQPQPVNSKNLTSVPKKIQGTWKDTGRNGYEESITIDHNSYRNIIHDRRRLAKSVADTSAKCRLSGGKIYFSGENSEIGYPYEVINDTVYYTTISEVKYVLSDSVLLRNSKKCLVVNLKNKEWWELVFIQKLGNGVILISYPVADDLMNMASKTNIAVIDSTKKDSVFFHARFKSGNIQRIIPKNKDGVLYSLFPDSTFTTVK